jgi:hypothetical protein
MPLTSFLLLAIGGLCLASTMHLAAGEQKLTNGPTLTVQLLNLAGVKAAELDRAVAEASWILSKAGVSVRWVQCATEAGVRPGAETCRESHDALTFSLGVVTKTPDFLRDTGMGFALVYSGGRNHAGVVYSKVVELAQANPRIAKADLVLAYAMVHEIAHLILGSTNHSPTGIMRAGCRPAELEALNQRRLLFGGKERKALHQKLLERQRRVEIGPTRIPGQ